MQAPMVHIVHHNGADIECYGELEDDSNFNIVCENEADDDVWCNGHPYGDSFVSWEEVVAVLYDYFDSPILEISAC